jgi:hypothetical protein
VVFILTNCNSVNVSNFSINSVVLAAVLLSNAPFGLAFGDFRELLLKFIAIVLVKYLIC